MYPDDWGYRWIICQRIIWAMNLIDESLNPEPNPPKPVRRWIFWSILIGAIIALLIAIGFGTLYAVMISNVRHVEVTDKELGENRPAKASSAAMNILLVGSDRREGKGAARLGERTDTIMLVHLPADRSELAVISFPRDLRVQLPRCVSKEGFPGQRAQRGIINSSYSAGGIGCIWKTIETLTGIHIDHFVMVDFTGFKQLVDAAGGVEVCLPQPIHDKLVKLDLPAGIQALRGDQALAYVRIRHGLSNGTDIGRIQRQQQFLSGLSKKVIGGGVLANPGKVISLLSVASKSVTTDPDLTPGLMMELALAVRGISAANIRFLTTPWRDSSDYPGRLELLDGPAKRLFRSIAEEEPFNRNDLKRSEPAIPLPAEREAEQENTVVAPPSNSKAPAPFPCPLI
ncbi:LCP family protein [Phyllobacterium sp. YR531]|uniref:LCP family protein n=1 Tax=Phyllobacterium sp. YR531 TaxID=1144343 RepID=UPI00026F52A0|nr:LCP family protein [Phyllobacterium sp. YR531]EJN02469.1 cell envelope-related function transcriptional attenuator common domain containing protein [Phyllobacterium sp. YR531]